MNLPLPLISLGSSVPQFRDAHFEGNSAEAGRARESRSTKNKRKVSLEYFIKNKTCFWQLLHLGYYINIDAFYT